MNSLRKLCVLALVALLFSITAGCEKETPALQVNDVVSDPAAFSGPLTIVGITYGYSRTDETVVGVMDKKELQCTTPNCNKVLLPVKTADFRPAIGDEVKITGTFSREAEGYLFRAESMEVLARHNLGGQG